jgi:hypothetical protein
MPLTSKQCRDFGVRITGIGSLISSQGEMLADFARVSDREGWDLNDPEKLARILGQAAHFASLLRDDLSEIVDAALNVSGEKPPSEHGGPSDAQ